MDKGNQFYWWLLGYDVEFPFYKDEMEVEVPDGWPREFIEEEPK